jgi:hypothetical protein
MTRIKKDIPPEVGNQIIKLLEDVLEEPVVFIGIMLPANVRDGEPAILSNIEPDDAERVIVWMGENLPRVRDSRIVIEGKEPN